MSYEVRWTQVRKSLRAPARKYINACVFLIAVAAHPALAFLNPCHFVGVVTISPYHPAPTDNLVAFMYLGAMPIAPNQVQVSKLTRAPDGSIHFSVVLTDDPTQFPDYQLGGEGVIGPLPEGQHKVLTTLDSYTKASGVTTPVTSCGLGPERAVPFTVFATTGIFPVVEYFNAGLGHYFMTQSADDMRALDTGVFGGWARTGESFLAYPPGESGVGTPIQRFYGLPSAGLDSHFFTGDLQELWALLIGPLTRAWAQEGVAFEIYTPNQQDAACQNDTAPVYRFWNARFDSNHRYTTSQSVKAEMLAKGWIAEGYGPNAVVFCAPLPRN